MTIQKTKKILKKRVLVKHGSFKRQVQNYSLLDVAQVSRASTTSLQLPQQVSIHIHVLVWSNSSNTAFIHLCFMYVKTYQITEHYLGFNRVLNLVSFNFLILELIYDGDDFNLSILRVNS